MKKLIALIILFTSISVLGGSVSWAEIKYNNGSLKIIRGARYIDTNETTFTTPNSWIIRGNGHIVLAYVPFSNAQYAIIKHGDKYPDEVNESKSIDKYKELEDRLDKLEALINKLVIQT